MTARVQMHTTGEPCEFGGCDWTGFHFHWRGERYRTAFPSTGREPALPENLLDDFGADCDADIADRERAPR